MGTGMSPIEAEAAKEALRKAYAAFNRNDIPATCEALDPNIEWTEPAEFPGGGTYHGHAGVRAYLTQSRANWAEGSSEPERLKGSGEWHETRLVDVVTFHNGKAIHMRAFAHRREGLKWAGLPDSDAAN